MKVVCIECGKKRSLSKENAERMLKANNYNEKLVQENYTCRICKGKKKEADKEAKREAKKEAKEVKKVKPEVVKEEKKNWKK